MSLSYKVVLVSRGAFIIAVCITTFLAITPQIHLPVVDKLDGISSHILAFYFLALLIDFAFPADFPLAVKFVLLLAYGVGIEIYQGQFTERTFSLLDLVSDAIGVMLYYASIPLLKKLPWFGQRWN
jgi:VanZ family protein